ncbi:MAG: hypothetical protein CSA60_04155 [Neptuniibacter caesariensis]|uniref:Uncharacterized protein n=1 Tax=Neptuniibacter caesariensis TaxID=207954 RepID=A0A2G6JM68_NEPCE|nr:MAG: hypothetical protein CSA60_04155 [Neptuniibacter caesariensis]
MQRILVVLIILIAAVTGYLYIDSQERTQPATISDATTPGVEQVAARAHISKLTQGTNQPILISQADNFVTADQLIKLPESTTQTTAELITDDPSEDEQKEGQTTIAINPLGNVVASSSDKRIIPSNTLQPLTLSGQVKLQELLDDPDQSSQKVYFIHAVNEGDSDGLWGIIQHGLMRTFTAGLSLPGLDKTVYVDIPEEADERLDDKRSSFLGQILKHKVEQTYIYNYQKGILGDNPDLIKPGQQLVIVTFSEQELIGIYHHFVNL